MWATVFALLLGFAPYVAGEGMTAVVAVQRENLAAIAVAVALGIGAWHARRDRRSRMLELLASTARPRWHRPLHTAAAIGIGAVTGFIVGFAATAGFTVAIGGYVPVVSFAAALVTALYLTAAIWLGFAICRMLPVAIVPPLLVVAGIVFGFFLFVNADLEGYVDRPPPGTVLLNPAQAEGFDPTEKLTAPAQLAQTVWAISLAAAGLILAIASRYFRLAAVVAVALGLALATSLLPRFLVEAINPDADAVALVCTSDDPQVCTRKIHPLVRDELADTGREALAILAAKLPQAPTTVVESYRQPGYAFGWAADQNAETLVAEIPVNGTGRIDATERRPVEPPGRCRHGVVRGRISRPNRIRAVPRSPFGCRRLAARGGATDALENEGVWSWEPNAALAGPAYEALLALPSDEQRARVAALREAELACDDLARDRLDILVGTGSST